MKNTYVSVFEDIKKITAEKNRPSCENQCNEFLIHTCTAFRNRYLLVV